jgi:O-antigen/teichoic acid export membrane protein
VKGSIRLRVGKNAAALLAGRMGVLTLGLWLNGQLARTVGIAGLGRYFLALTVEGITLSLVNMGLNIYATREFARNEDEATRALLGTVLRVKAIAASLGIGLLNVLVAPYLFPGVRQAAIAWASLGLLPQALNGGMEAVLKGRQHMELSSLIELGTRVAAVVGGLIWLSQGGDERHVLICYVGGHLLTTLVLGGVLTAWRVMPRRQHWHGRTSELLQQAVAFAGVDIAAMLYRRMGMLLLSTWHGDAVVGIYGAAYRLWETLGVLPGSFLDALFPELARSSAGAGGLARLRYLTRRAGLALLALVLAVGGACFALAPRIVSLLYGAGADMETVTRLFRLLLLALPFTYLYLLNGHVLYATGAQHQVLGAMAAVTLGNVLLNTLLIPRWGYWGAAGVTLVSEGALLLLLGVAARRRITEPLALDGSAI